MSEFVEECRREWKRLRVPDPVANEMAADLAADLKEAESEGASAEDVLGSAAFDAPSFAFAWAAERGVIPPAPALSNVTSPRRSARFAVPVMVTLLAIAAVVAGVAILTSGSGSAQFALASPAGASARHAIITHLGSGRLRLVRPNATVPGFFIPPALVLPGPARAFAAHVAGGNRQPVGWILFIGGVVGLIVSTLYWLSRAGPAGVLMRR